MTWLYSGTILLGSCLLFLVQPMCAKMLLPLVGGTPMAWNTCMVFFQVGLLCGYAYAHALPARFALLHPALLIAAFFLLPIRLPSEMPDDWHPVAWLLASLTMSVGLPFVLLAAGAPLVQRWFVARHPGRDPYFLYAASNLGSFLALGLFPFVLEPYWPLAMQSEIWKYSFLAMTALLAFCVPMRFNQPDAQASGSPTPTQSLRFGWEHVRWIILAMIPSSLLLSVTTHLTTDVAAIPLLWLIPMGLYLLTFAIVFAHQQWVPRWALLRYLPLVVVVLVFVMLSEATQPMPLVMGVHLFAFFWLALVCHGELSRTRPDAEHLTIFYLCLALGGVLGGALNALIAPLLFPALYEYPLMIVLACALGMNAELFPTRDDWLFAAGLGVATVVIVLFLQSLALSPGPISVAAMFGLPLIVCYAMHQQATRFTLGLIAILLASGLYHGIYGASAYRERSYFGIHRVTKIDGFHRLVHGNTIHGQQRESSGLPLAYYAKSGPIGDVFHAYHSDPRLRNVGVVGLGTGSLAAYSQLGQDWTFFEIDPSVKRIAENPKLFTYLRDAEGHIRIELGDARLRLQKTPQKFGLLVVDAFGSDAIPVHLLTREALDVYLDHLEPDGILAFHISNHYLDLEPVLANLAADRNCVAYLRQHEPTAEEKVEGIMSSHWLVIARREDDLKPLLKNADWRPAKARPDLAVWTDDYSNLLSVFRWRSQD
jgi:spermidine synthase